MNRVENCYQWFCGWCSVNMIHSEIYKTASVMYITTWLLICLKRLLPIPLCLLWYNTTKLPGMLWNAHFSVSNKRKIIFWCYSTHFLQLFSHYRDIDHKIITFLCSMLQCCQKLMSQVLRFWKLSPSWSNSWENRCQCCQWNRESSCICMKPV